MVKLDRYIGVHVFLAILTVLGIIVGLALLFAFIDELSDVEGSYGLGDALQYVLLTSPRRLYEMLPMAALIGCLIGLGTLASSSELTIMRAAGVSLGRIVVAVMKPMLVLLIAGILIGEYVAPATEDIAQARRSLAQGAGEAQSSKRGLWHRQENEFVHVNAVQPGGMLVGVTRYRFDDERRLLSSSFARRASYQADHWLLENISTTHFRGDHTEVVRTPQERWDVQLTPQLLGTVVMEPEALSITGLWRYPLPGRAGVEQRSLLAGILDQGAAAGRHRCAGAAGDLVHLRATALGHAWSAHLYRRSGRLRISHYSGFARAG